MVTNAQVIYLSLSIPLRSLWTTETGNFFFFFFFFFARMEPNIYVMLDSNHEGYQNHRQVFCRNPLKRSDGQKIPQKTRSTLGSSIQLFSYHSAGENSSVLVSGKNIVTGKNINHRLRSKCQPHSNNLQNFCPKNVFTRFMCTKLISHQNSQMLVAFLLSCVE